MTALKHNVTAQRYKATLQKTLQHSVTTQHSNTNVGTQRYNTTLEHNVTIQRCNTTLQHNVGAQRCNNGHIRRGSVYLLKRTEHSKAFGIIKSGRTDQNF